jgi:hypothetical protein
MAYVKELDLILKRLRDGRWGIYQRRSGEELLIRGPFPARSIAEMQARKLQESVRCDLFVEVTPGIREPLGAVATRSRGW